MKSIGVIPARFASSRFPGKPLAILGGLSLIQRVYQRAQSTKLDDIIVATDDERIYQHVQGFGGKVLMTSAAHQSGTDRCAEVASQTDADILVNIQGDEPFFPKDAIDAILQIFQEGASAQIVTLSHLINDEASIFNEHIVKVVSDQSGRALYFSRSPIPYLRGTATGHWHQAALHYQHIGIYAFRARVLTAISQLPVSTYERAESLEQLRWLQAGYHIQLIESDSLSIGIDTPADLARAEALLRE